MIYGELLITVVLILVALGLVMNYATMVGQLVWNPAVPKNIDEYISYKDLAIKFINQRNQQILENSL